MIGARLLIALSATLALSVAAPARAQTVDICHATGSPNNPYQQISVSGQQLDIHSGHDDDIIPAPDGGCPAQLPTATPTATPAPGAASPAPPSGQLNPSPEATPIYGVPRPDGIEEVPLAPLSDDDELIPRERVDDRPRGDEAPSGAAEGEPVPVSATFPQTVRGTTAGSLANTGGEPFALALLGLSLLLSGLGVRLRLDGR